MTNKQQIKNIIDALHAAESGEIVYAALHNIPTDNLLDMIHMIQDILHHRHKEHSQEKH